MHEHVRTQANFWFTMPFLKTIFLKLYRKGYDFYSFIVVVSSMLRHTPLEICFFAYRWDPSFGLDLPFVLQYYVVKFTITDPNCFHFVVL